MLNYILFYYHSCQCIVVIIDVNDYLPNRFFTTISLTNKLFINNNDITFTDNSYENNLSQKVTKSFIQTYM